MICLCVFVCLFFAKYYVSRGKREGQRERDREGAVIFLFQQDTLDQMHGAIVQETVNCCNIKSLMRMVRRLTYSSSPHGDALLSLRFPQTLNCCNVADTDDAQIDLLLPRSMAMRFSHFTSHKRWIIDFSQFYVTCADDAQTDRLTHLYCLAAG